MTNLKFKIRGLKKSFAGHQVLKSIDLDVVKDSSLVILGGSGTGKSVLIKSIIGLIKADEGSILYDGEESINFNESQRKVMLQNCGYLFQAGALFDSLTIAQNVTFFAEKIYNLTKKELRDLAVKKLNSVGLSERVLNLYPSELSGGMQKRAALARTICTDPKVIFFDEPTTGLDPIMSNVINDLIVKVRDELSATTITITHDMNSAKKIGKEIAFLQDGQILWNGDVTMLENSGCEYVDKFIKGEYPKNKEALI